MIKVLDFWSLETLNYGTNNIVIVLNIKNKLYNGHFASIINDNFLYSKKKDFRVFLTLIERASSLFMISIEKSQSYK